MRASFLVSGQHSRVGATFGLPLSACLLSAHLSAWSVCFRTCTSTGLGNAVLLLLVTLNLGDVIYAPLDRWTGRRKLVVACRIGILIALLLALAALGDELGLWATLVLLVAFAAFSQLHALVVAQAQSLFGPQLAGRVITTTNLFMTGGIFIYQFGSG